MEDMGDKRKKYAKEFKLRAIRLLESGTKPGHEIEHDLGIGSGQIYHWRKQFSQDGARAFPGNGKSRDEELAALRKEIKNLREERDILRKSNRRLLQTTEMKYAFMSEQRSAHSVEKMTQVLGVARSGFYAWGDRAHHVRIYVHKEK